MCLLSSSFWVSHKMFYLAADNVWGRRVGNEGARGCSWRHLFSQAVTEVSCCCCCYLRREWGLKCQRPFLRVPTPLIFTGYCIYVIMEWSFRCNSSLWLMTDFCCLFHTGMPGGVPYYLGSDCFRQFLCAYAWECGCLSCLTPPVQLNSDLWLVLGSRDFFFLFFLLPHQQWADLILVLVHIIGPRDRGFFLFSLPYFITNECLLVLLIGSVSCPSSRGKQISFLPFQQRQWILYESCERNVS